MAGGVKTLPIWIFQSFRLANQVPLVNVAGLAAILLSVIPVYLATRLSGGVVGRARLTRLTTSCPRRAGEGDRDDREGSRDRDESIQEPAHGAPPPTDGRSHVAADPSTECPVRDRRGQYRELALRCRLIRTDRGWVSDEWVFRV